MWVWTPKSLIYQMIDKFERMNMSYVENVVVCQLKNPKTYLDERKIAMKDNQVNLLDESLKDLTNSQANVLAKRRQACHRQL